MSYDTPQWLSLEIRLVHRQSDLAQSFDQWSLTSVYPEIEWAKPVNVYTRETTLRKSRWKEFLDKSASVTSRGIGYSGKYSRKSWFIAQLLEKAPRIGLGRQRQSPRWFSLSRPREGRTREPGVTAISIKGRKTLNDERRPVPFLKFALADTNELQCRDRVCLRDRETLFPFIPLSCARTIMVMHTSFMPLEHVFASGNCGC